MYPVSSISFGVMGSPAFRPLPYSIPGPAGDTQSLYPSSHASGTSLEAEVWGGTEFSGRIDPRSFSTGAWQAMLSSGSLEPYGRRKMCTSIVSLKRKAYKYGFARAEHISVRILGIEFIGNDALVLFGDVTGQICGTVNREVFKKMNGDMDVGSVLLLEGVGGLLCFDDHPGIRRSTASAYVHLSVQLENVANVFPYYREAPSKVTVACTTLEHLKEAYTDDALQVGEYGKVPKMRQELLVLRRRFSFLLARQTRRPNSSTYLQGAQKLGKVKKISLRGKKKATLGGPRGNLHDTSRKRYACRSLGPAECNAENVKGISKLSIASSSLCDDGLDDLFLSLDIEAAIAASKV